MQIKHDHHVKLAALFTGIQRARIVVRHHAFADCDEIIVVCQLPDQLLDVGMGLRQIGHELFGKLIALLFRMPARQSRLLGNRVDDVHAEAADTFVKPEQHDVGDFFADPRILPVDIALVRREGSQIPAARFQRILCPCAAAEHADPVVRFLIVNTLAEVVTIPVRTVRIV